MRLLLSILFLGNEFTLSKAISVGSADCQLSGIAGFNAGGIDTTFLSLQNVPTFSTDSGVTMQFDSFNCNQVIKTGAALTSMVSVGVRPVILKNSLA